MDSEKNLIIAMVESLENFNSRLLTLSEKSDSDHYQIMNKILHNLETIELLKNNEMNGVYQLCELRKN